MYGPSKMKQKLGRVARTKSTVVIVLCEKRKVNVCVEVHCMKHGNRERSIHVYVYKTDESCSFFVKLGFWNVSRFRRVNRCRM